MHKDSRDPDQERDDCLTVLRSGGAVCHKDDQTKTYVFQSIYIPRFVGHGITEIDAYRDYLRVIQEPLKWRAIASEFLPTLKDEFACEDDPATPMQLWIEVWQHFEKAYMEPRDEDLIRRVYAFADWCELQDQDPDTSAGNDLPTCVIVCFYEHLPANAKSREDMPRWFTLNQVDQMKDTFSYLYDDFDKLRELFERSQG
jgi:hypothetical protein